MKIHSPSVGGYSLGFGLSRPGSGIKGPEVGVSLEDYGGLEVKQGCHSLMGYAQLGRLNPFTGKLQGRWTFSLYCWVLSFSFLLAKV